MTRSRSTALLFGAAVVAWAVTVVRMRGMDAGPGTDLGGLGWYLGIWVTMTAAMMLPSVAPAARHAARLARRAPTVLFTAGYLAVWTGYGLAAYGLFRVVTSLDLGWLAWDRGGPYLAGGVIVGAGLYELTPLKQLSLRRCRSAQPSRHPTSQRSRARARLCGLLRRPDGGAVRAGRDEHLLDGGRRRRDLRGEGSAAGRSALGHACACPGRPGDLDRRSRPPAFRDSPSRAGPLRWR